LEHRKPIKIGITETQYYRNRKGDFLAKETKDKKDKKTKGQRLEEKLSYKPEFIWKDVKKKDLDALMSFSEGYKDFLHTAKTERECVRVFSSYLESKGFKHISKLKGKPKPGTKLFGTNREKNLVAIVVGKKPLSTGINIIASHVDAPRVDLKQIPLNEDGDTGIAFFKTHYYGGIKKYHWVNIPLALHGVVVRKDGSKVDITIGEKEDDPVLILPDLLPHLARKKQGDRKFFDGIRAEEMNILVGSIPFADKKVKQKIKLNILKYLNDNYGMIEEDFVSAELELVPASRPRDVGLDRSFVGGYGQDDRICAYTSVQAITELEKPEHTAMALLLDKEEIGSDGATGIKSKFMEHFVGKLLALEDKNYHHGLLQATLENSRALSSDVNAGVNPIFKDVHDLTNASFIGKGVILTKYTGSGGKYMANDASAEYVGKIRKLFNDNKLPWQFGNLGKVDEGGGGTVAKFLAIYNMDIIDCGPGLLSMHSPYEISSKADVYYSYRAYKLFFEKLVA
jgi:aspartyl aminopeptidase